MLAAGGLTKLDSQTGDSPEDGALAAIRGNAIPAPIEKVINPEVERYPALDLGVTFNG